MPRKSKAAQSRIKNLGFNAQKQQKLPSVTMEEVEDDDESNTPGHQAAPSANLESDNRRISSDEGFVFEEEDGSLTLVGFLNDFEEESLPDFASDSDLDEEDDGKEDSQYPEIFQLSDLERFSHVLAEAQRIAVAAEDGFTGTRLLFNQPDFVAQKSKLEEFVISRGHICDFYPKYHCELNFIEQYWGAAKFRYRNTPKTNNIVEMERNMLACLDDIPLLQIQRYANRSARFISRYDLGLSGAEAAWVNKKYHGHRTLPPIMLAEVWKAQINMPAPL